MNNINNQFQLLKFSPVILLIFTASIVFLRTPASFIIFTILVLFCFLFTRYKRNLSISLGGSFVHAFFILGLMSSLVALFLSSKVIFATSYFLPLASFYLFHIVMSMSSRYPIYPQSIERVMFYSFSIIAIIALMEVILNTNLASVIHPLSANLPYLEADRFVVSSIFVNYNDFSAVMFIYTLQLIFRFLGESNLIERGFYSLMFLFVLGVCLYMGSRGYLASLIIFLIIRIYLSLRLRMNRVSRGLLFITSTLLLGSGGLLLVNQYQSYFLDNSNLTRLLVFSNYFQLSLMDVKLFIFGFGELLNFQELASIDPHNLFLEIAIGYGAAAFIAFLLLYIYAAFYFFKNSEYFDHCEEVLMTIFILSFVYGTISSSSLRFYYIYFIVVAVPSIISNVKIRKSSSMLL